LLVLGLAVRNPGLKAGLLLLLAAAVADEDEEGSNVHC
jgi:hypothetical protein